MYTVDEVHELSESSNNDSHCVEVRVEWVAPTPLTPGVDTVSGIWELGSRNLGNWENRGKNLGIWELNFSGNWEFKF